MARPRTTWSSMAIAFTEDAAPTVRRVEIDAAWVGWNLSPDKALFVSSIPLPIATALTDRIMRDVPPGLPTARARTKKGPSNDDL